MDEMGLTTSDVRLANLLDERHEITLLRAMVVLTATSRITIYLTGRIEVEPRGDGDRG